jgi:hypothetical protein
LNPLLPTPGYHHGCSAPAPRPHLRKPGAQRAEWEQGSGATRALTGDRRRAIRIRQHVFECQLSCRTRWLSHMHSASGGCWNLVTGKIERWKLRRCKGTALLNRQNIERWPNHIAVRMCRVSSRLSVAIICWLKGETALNSLQPGSPKHRIRYA